MRRGNAVEVAAVHIQEDAEEDSRMCLEYYYSSSRVVSILNERSNVREEERRATFAGIPSRARSPRSAGIRRVERHRRHEGDEREEGEPSRGGHSFTPPVSDALAVRRAQIVQTFAEGSIGDALEKSRPFIRR